jgi:dienelactone hydrolase
MATHAMVARDLRIAGRVLAVLAALWLTCAVTVPGQQPVADAGLLRWYQGPREIGRETFRRTALLFETETQVPMLNARLRYRSEYDAQGRLVRFEAQALALRTDSLIRRYTAEVQGDTLRIHQVGGRPADTSWAKAARVEGVTAAQSLASMLELAERAAGAARAYVVWSPESNDTLRFSTSAAHGDSIDLQLGPFTMTALLGPGGRVQRLDIPMQRLRAERWSGSGDTLPPLEGAVRPPADYSAPAAAPFTAREVRVPVRPSSGDTFSLGCTLTLPKAGRAPYPVVMTITGSGLQDRDENLWPLVPGYRPFRQIAERVAAAGIATLRCDDRSFGASTGNAQRATTSDFAEDACAEVGWLQARPEIDGARIALVGHSEGGVIAPMVARMHPSVAAVVLMAGTAKNGVEVLKDQVTWPVESMTGLTPERRAQLRAEAITAVVADTTPNPWMQFFRQYDPLPTARRVRQPSLILQGALDRQVTAGQADTLGEGIRSGGNRDVTVRVFPGLNHLFVPSPTDGSPSEYAALTDVAVNREVLETLANWLVQKLRPGAAGRRPAR